MTWMKRAKTKSMCTLVEAFLSKVKGQSGCTEQLRNIMFYTSIGPPGIILDKQMRLSEDDPFRDLLSRARAGTLTEADRAVLNSKTITSLASPQPQDATHCDTR